jgi:hypothetical protein
MRDLDESRSEPVEEGRYRIRRRRAIATRLLLFDEAVG